LFQILLLVLANSISHWDYELRVRSVEFGGKGEDNIFSWFSMMCVFHLPQKICMYCPPLAGVPGVGFVSRTKPLRHGN